MKNYRIMILAVLLTMVGRALADNLTVETVKMSAGETKQVAIVLNNPTHKYAAFQFDLVLPEGISIAKNNKGKLDASLNENRKDDHTLNVSETGTNTYRFLAFSMTNTEFSGTDGTLVYVTLQASESISEGNKTVTIQSQVFTEVSGEQYKWDNTTFTVEIGGSGGSDNPDPPVTGDDMLNVEAVSMSAGETKQIAIVLNNPTHKYAAFQFDLVLPEGISIAKNDKGKFIASLNENRKDDHTLNVSETGTNTYRFLAFSMTNTEFSGTDGALVYVTLQANESISEGNKTATIQSQVFTEVSGEQYKWGDKTFQITIEAVASPITITAKSYTREYGEDNPSFEYTVTGGTISSGVPTITCAATKTSPVGTYDIVIEKGTVSNKSVELVKGTLTINKAPLTITAKSYTIKQGDALPTFEAEYAGFKNNETATVLQKAPTLSTTATSASEPGTYDIVVSGAEAGNYDITYVKGTLTITKADEVVVTAKNYSRKYGEANPTFEFTTSDATLSGTPSITCEATATSPVGEYDIVVSKGSVTNYNVTFVNGKLTVTKAPLTITAKSYTIKQGDALPTFEAEYAGFKNNETSSVLSTQPRITTTATSTDVAGEYDINVSGADAQNYDISYVKGKLIIEKVDVDPITETETTTFSSEMNESTDLSNTVIGNTYYSMNAENGDGYDATEQAIVLNSTTTADQMNTVQNATVGNAAIKQNFNGIIFEIAAGTGAVYVDVKTKGTHVLKVQIGKSAPTTITKTERETVGIDYNVSEPTYVYLYASTASGGSAPLKRASAGANSVLLYGYKITPGSNTGIGVLTVDDMEKGSWYTVDGRKLQGKPTAKGLYIINGRKVVVK